MKMKNVEDVYALSPMQQLMLVHSLASAGQDVLVEELSCTLEGELDSASMRRAWETVIQRHPVLRTAFVWEGLKKPLQIVRQKVALPWHEHDWQTLSPEEQAERSAQMLRDARQQGFDLTAAPLMRLTLIRTGSSRFEFLWSCHHLVLDGWCLSVVLREVLAHYEAFRQGHDLKLDHPRPFRDYIAWLAKQDATEAEEFWRHYLAGYTRPVRLPVERPADQVATEAEQYDEKRTELSASATESIRTLAARLKTTGSTIVEGAWALLLARYGDTDDAVYGATVSGRPPLLPGVESMIGPFINNLPVRISVQPDAETAAWLSRLHAAKAELRQFEYTPLDQIQRLSAMPQGRRLFESLVVFENYPVDTNRFARFGGLTISEIHGSATANFPLTLIVIPGERLSLRVRYDCRYFEADVVDRLASDLLGLLEGILVDPSRRLSDLRLGSGVGPTPFSPDRLSTELQPGALKDAQTQALLAECNAPGDASGGPGDLQQLVLDTWNQPAPVGVPGELSLARAGATPEWFATGDRVRHLADGRLEYLGRVDDPVQVGIYRVDPEQVRSTLLEHQLVRDALVRPHRDPMGETQLAAYVIPAKESKTLLDPTEHALLLGQLRAFLAEHLPETVVPKALVAVEEWPMATDGSVDVDALPPPTRPRPDSVGPMVAPRDPLEAQLAALWSELLGVYPIGVTDNFMDLGGQSVLAVSLMARIEERFGRKLPLLTMFHRPTIEHFAEMLRRPADTSEARSLVPIRPQGSRRPLYCVHPAGGTVFCYLELMRYLDDDQPLYGLQAQGVEGEAPPHAEVEEMAEHYVKAIRTEQPTGPYQVCGWSSGGVIAFEVARQLREQGDEVAMLALFDAGVQSSDEEAFDKDDFLPMLMMMFPGQSEEEVRALQQRSPEEQLAYFQQRAELAQLVVAGAAALQAQHVFDVFQANVHAMTRYRPQLYPGKITLFRASEHATPMHKDPYLGWGPWAEEGIDVHEVPGSHVTMFRPPTIKALALGLQAELDRLN